MSTPHRPSEHDEEFKTQRRGSVTSTSKLHVVAVATAYDTGFESVRSQAHDRAAALRDHFESDPRVGRLSFVIKNDAPWDRPFTDPAQRGLFEAAPDAVTEGAFVVEPLFGARPGPFGMRGLAYVEGIQWAVEREADVVMAINLNRKVPIADIKRTFVHLVTTEADVVVGTRAQSAGGDAIGAGALGRAKSELWRRAARHAVPSIDRFSDPNAPVKVMRARAAKHLVRHAHEAGICPDVEWLALWTDANFVVDECPITWTQCSKSRPPWTQVPRMLADLARLRRRLAHPSLGPRSREPISSRSQ